MHLTEEGTVSVGVVAWVARAQVLDGSHCSALAHPVFVRGADEDLEVHGGTSVMVGGRGVARPGESIDLM